MCPSIGVSIRRNKMIAMLLNDNWECLQIAETAFSSRDAPQDSTVERLAELLVQITEVAPEIRRNVRIIGVELSGHIDGKSGEVVYCPDLQDRTGHWRHVNLAHMLEAVVGDTFPVARVMLENDINALAAFEAVCGDGAGYEDFAIVVVGEQGHGVGCGVVSSRRLIRGTRGGAGELGHVVISQKGRVCRRCGHEGCLEVSVGADAILSVLRKGEGFPTDLSEASLRVEEGDILAGEAFGRAGERLGFGLSILINLFNPQRIIVQGPSELLSPEGSVLSAERYKSEMRFAAHRFSYLHFADDCTILVKEGDDSGGTRGAAISGSERLGVTDLGLNANPKTNPATGLVGGGSAAGSRVTR